MPLAQGLTTIFKQNCLNALENFSNTSPYTYKIALYNANANLDNSTTTYDDAIADTALGAAAPTDQGQPPNYSVCIYHAGRLFVIDPSDKLVKYWLNKPIVDFVKLTKKGENIKEMKHGRQANLESQTGNNSRDQLKSIVSPGSCLYRFFSVRVGNFTGSATRC